MVQIIKELNVDVTKPNVFQAIVAKQYDMNTRFLKVTFTDCGKKIEIPLVDTNKVIINAERNDGLSKGFDGVINDDGTVTVPLHSWMLERDGTVICDISVICGNDKKLTTTSFTLIVEKAAFGGDDITSDPQFDVLVALLDAATVAQEALDKSNEANSKYDACVEATENANKAADNANAVREEVEAGGYIESLKEMNDGGKFSMWVGTEKEYENDPDKLTKNRLHIITDEEDIDEMFAAVNEKITQSVGKTVHVFDTPQGVGGGGQIPALANMYYKVFVAELNTDEDGKSGIKKYVFVFSEVDAKDTNIINFYGTGSDILFCATYHIDSDVEQEKNYFEILACEDGEHIGEDYWTGYYLTRLIGII